jgi:hypothetical protein
MKLAGQGDGRDRARIFVITCRLVGRRPWFTPKSRLKELSEARPTSRRSRAAHTDTECLGADVNALVTQRMIGLAKRQLGAVPQFWGRYFYQAQLEGPVLRTNNIRVLPIAQQTNHVDGDGPLGSQDGLRNAAAIIASFGRTYLSGMRGIFVFFDVECNQCTRSIIEDGATL